MSAPASASSSSSSSVDDFPILCESCLGPNPLLRMTKQFGVKPCKICDRPFTVYRWQPAPGRFKKTELCKTCAQIKNVCQTCVLDLTFGVPVQVRDSLIHQAANDNTSNALIQVSKLPSSDAGRADALQRLEQRLLDGGHERDILDGYNKAAKASAVLQKLARRNQTPYYARNSAPYCTYFVAGNCNRGSLCPFRHEMPPGGALSKQNIKDRYEGVNDPVAEKLLAKERQRPIASADLSRPQDPSASTLFIAPLPDADEQAVKSAFGSFAALITSVRLLPGQGCGFVSFARQDDAAAAAAALNGNFKVNGNFCKLDWAKGKSKSQTEATNDNPAASGAPASAAPARSAPPGVKKKVSSILPDLPPLPQLTLNFSQAAYPSEAPLSKLADQSGQ